MKKFGSLKDKLNFDYCENFEKLNEIVHIDVSKINQLIN